MNVRRIAVFLIFLAFTATSLFAQTGDPAVLAQMARVNRALAQRGLGIAVE